MSVNEAATLQDSGVFMAVPAYPNLSRQMSDSLIDIEALTLRCRADRAREYVQEAIMCYRAGAYRSAIVNSWIAVVFDLIEKVRAYFGDHDR